VIELILVKGAARISGTKVVKTKGYVTVCSQIKREAA
jgi:hypothetical protein